MIRRHRRTARQAANYVWLTLCVAVSRLQTSIDPNVTLARLREHRWSFWDLEYAFNAALWVFSASIIPSPLLKFGVPILYLIAISLPITSQFLFPALPVLTWVFTFFCSRFIPVEYRPHIFVSVLPTLESVLYGANISDILTRFTHPVLDIPAWLSYGVIHFVGPFVLAAFLWLFAARGTLKYFALSFGYMNLTGVLIQLVFPCAAPWYELRNGLTPANYGMSGSPGGLARIDAIFHSHGYTTTFSNAPLIFGAFPSLHAGNATTCALFISHFWPFAGPYAFAYAGVLYWATMYLTHHYLIDVVGGACLATAWFYITMPLALQFPDNTTNLSYAVVNGDPRGKYEEYGLDYSRVPNGGYRPSSPGAASLSDQETPPNPLAPYGHSRRPSSPFTPSPRILGSFMKGHSVGRNHRHTASIASLIRSEDRVEDGWSPISRGFGFPPTGPPLLPTTMVLASPSSRQSSSPQADVAPAATNVSSNGLMPLPEGVETNGATVRSRSPAFPENESKRTET
ncbi:uncharacterized protein EI90DRAFT_2969496 [Cantharellus anzutake]|uniref:uncharacterized protein n=1 Tax=Cantharellus anzutake TaxID=1750568 RepID=UPI0019072466|nr:uncharacterized protein EI90DRAFT_2969496 [Cantharellus anzutake]KAF8335888.1 hypothetical protein EI90DRAFT_2969496 [Cantharellus anzutake]